MTEKPFEPFELFLKSQQAAFKMATDIATGLATNTARTVRDAATASGIPTDDLVRQVGDLAGVVGSMAGAVTGLAGATAQPLQDFLVRQRELADTVATLADAQADLAEVVSRLAERHAEAVTALENLTAPLFSVIGTAPTEPLRNKAKRSTKKTTE